MRPIFVLFFVSQALGLQDWETTLLNKHNDLRSKVALGNQPGAPPAAYMAKMTWDPELASAAQAWANQCQGMHDENRGEDIGENRFNWPDLHDNFGSDEAYGTKLWKDYLDPSADSGIDTGFYDYLAQVWFDEGKDYTGSYDSYDAGASRTGGQIGHYTQMVWGTSAKLGCGVKTGCPGFDWFQLYCRYKPTGNTYEAPIYPQGPACSQCKGTCSEGLCSGEEGNGGSETTSGGGQSTTGVATDGTTTGAPEVQSTTSAADRSTTEAGTPEPTSTPEGTTGVTNTSPGVSPDAKTTTEKEQTTTTATADTTTTRGPTGQCSDRFQSCPGSQRWCGRIPWITADCPFSCSDGRCDGSINPVCQDFLDRCADEKRWCGTTDWVVPNCPSTCSNGKCDGTVDPGCFDCNAASCPSQAMYCDYSNIAECCRKTCQKC